MANDVSVTGADNRGTPDVPYGFVYFTDGARLGFGDARDGLGKFGLFEAGHGWPSVAPIHYVLASEKLSAELPDFVAFS